MIRVTTFAGRRVAVFGLGSSGLATVRALEAGGADVAAWDDGEASRDAAVKAGVSLVDLRAADWSAFAALVLAPGVPLTHPEPHWTVGKARAAGIEVIGDIELFCRERRKLCPTSPFIAITGTNGKSTTTALLAHLLRRAGRDVQMGGNIGTAILSLDPPAPHVHHIVEMSSFQIDLTPSLDPTVGVLLNLSPDHLDRHGPADDADLAMRNYAAIKERLVAASQAVCIGIEDDWCRAIFGRLQAAGRRIYPFAVQNDAGASPAIYAEGSRILAHAPGATHDVEIASVAGVGTLRGRHNVQNAMAAIAAISALQDCRGGGSLEDLRGMAAALPAYPGLPHRMEEVGRAGKVLFINDSKATNADSTEKALASWPRDIFWILGGKPKEGGIAPLAAYFPRIAKAYLIGYASDAFAATLEGRVPFERCSTLDVALARAAEDAAASPGAEPVVLLSPACASYDQFRSFEHRGNVFRDLVIAREGVASARDGGPP
ncbi:MAG: UDP-N-acetylmuramoyl-L-alanine--D-glutamate ligase [Hyphomicrobiaceae bacterium]